MAIAPTGAIYKSLIFDGENSRNYGVYITGQAVYNAPVRDVEMISIPGRNGAFALDKGRFENIEVSYPAGIFADTEANFAQAISDFRNLLCSRSGYVRLTDEYNPDEYRMAVYKSGLEVEPAQLKAGEFDIVFDCKPQRYLMSGESALNVESGDVILNPTLFESSPMLEVEGYGTIGFNEYEVEIENAVMGDVEIAAAQQWNPLSTFHYIIRKAQKALYNIGDTLTLKSTVFEFYIEGDAYSYVVTGGTASDSNSSFSTQYLRTEGSRAYFRTSISPLTFTAGTDSTVSDTITISATTQSSGAKTFTLTLDVTYEAEGSYEQSYIDLMLNATLPQHYYKNRSGGTGGAVIADSTISILGHPTYIDCDLGEAYLIKDGLPISLNQHIDLGSDLPKLAVGSNEITFDNTITDLKVLPRWWKV